MVCLCNIDSTLGNYVSIKSQLGDHVASQLQREIRDLTYEYVYGKIDKDGKSIQSLYVFNGPARIQWPGYKRYR